MPELGRFSRELRARLWKPTVDDEVRDEMRAHMEQLEEALIAQGVPPEQARLEARRRFGDSAAIARECRDIGERRDREFRVRRYGEELAYDVRQAFRQMQRAPRFALAALATLAIGLGASTTIFSLANAVLFRPLPFDRPDRLLIVNEVTPEGMPFSVSEPNYLDWVSRSSSFVSWAALTGRTATLTGDGGGEPEQVRGVMATHTLFPMLGVAPLRGRGFLPEEDAAGGDTLVALISAALWQRRYGGEPGIVGRRIEIDGVAHRVVGVIPEGRAMPSDVDVWTPLSPTLDFPRGDRRLEVFARLRDGVSREQAVAELAAVHAELRERYPQANQDWGANVTPFRQWFVSPQFEHRVLALLATVVLLLVMACTNVGNLLLSRVAMRTRELAVRSALGAGSARLARQLLTESMVLALAGAVAGTVIALLAVPVLRRVAGETVPRLDTLSVDWRVLVFAAGAAVVSGFLFGAVPVLRLGRSRASMETLRSGTRLAPGGRTRSALIIASVSLATVLLVSASLVGRSFLALMRADLGFDPRGVTIANVSTANDRYDSQRTIDFVRTVLEGVRSAPGVDAVGATVTPPFGRGNLSQGFIKAELANPSREGYRIGSWRAVTPGYFETLRIPVVRGRTFTDADRADGEIAVVINETLARQAFGEEDPIGRRLASSNGQVKTVIGVVRDTRHLYLDSLPNPTMYWAHAQFPMRSMWVVVRGSGDVIGAVRSQVRALDPLLPVANVRPLTALVDDRTAEARLTMLVFTIFATAALVLAAVGLYGVIAYTVSQRTREIGVTLALGARPALVVRRVLGDGMQLSVVGVAVGLLFAAWATSLLRAILYETSPTDVATYVGVGVLLVLIGAVASAIPARRAARLDPVVALREE
jgi:predicted permease